MPKFMRSIYKLNKLLQNHVRLGGEESLCIQGLYTELDFLNLSLVTVAASLTKSQAFLVSLTQTGTSFQRHRLSSWKATL